MVEAFEYKSLPGNHIRLLNISSSDSGPSLPLYEIEVVDIDNAGAFFALSYTWDGQTPDQPISCNGGELMVTLNVYTLVPHLLDRYGQLRIWIDGVCINQRDAAEKSVQVPMMGKIYSEAKKVIIWLGVETPETAEAIKEIPTLTTKLKSHGGFNFRKGDPDYELALRELPPRSSSVWVGLYHIYARPWFSRLWVLQEALLAQEADFICGSKDFSVQDLIELNLMMDNTYATPLLVAHNRTGNHDAMKRGCITCLHIMQGRGERAAHGSIIIYPLISMTRDLQAYDPRDNIYGILGVADEDFRRLIRVDYNSSVTDLYFEVAKYLLEIKQPKLNILHLTNHYDETPEVNLNLPSWCPNFHTSKITTSLPGSGFTAGFVGEIEALYYKAYIPPSSQALHVTAIKLGEITDVVESTFWASEAEMDGQTSAELHLSCLDCCLWTSRKAYHDRPEALEACSRTLIADAFGSSTVRATMGESPEALPAASLVQNFLRLQIRLMQMAGQPLNEHQRVFIEASDVDGSTVETDVKIYMLSILEAWRHRSFFATSDGRVGLGPEHLQEGDLVCIIVNAYTPFVLRPRRDNSGCFELIGEAYVDGIMHGEFFNNGEPQYETIKID